MVLTHILVIAAESRDDVLGEIVVYGLDWILLVQHALLLLDLTIVSIAVQRDLERGAVCNDGTSPLDQTVVRMCTPTIVAIVGRVTPLPWLFRGVSLGCQIHDTALSTRGMCTRHRTARWVQDGPAYIVMGMVVDGLVRAHAPRAYDEACVYLASMIVCAVATCQPIEIVESPATLTWVEMGLRAPYRLSYQLLERSRRAFAAGVFAPDIEQSTPVATTLLRLHAMLHHPGVQWILPVELAQPQIHYLMAELVSAEALEDALRQVSELIKTSKTTLKRGAAMYLPSKIVGVPSGLLHIIRQILSDPNNMNAVRDVQQQLARRLSDARQTKPLTFSEWRLLGIDPTDVALWDLDASLSESTWVDLIKHPMAEEESSWCEIGPEDVWKRNK